MTITKEKIQQWLPHIIGLFFIIVLPMFVFSDADARLQYWKNKYYYQLIFMIIAFYINYLVFIPRFFFSEKRIRFFIIALVFVVGLLAFSQFLLDYFDHFLRPPRMESRRAISPKMHFKIHPGLFNNFLLLLLVIGFSSGLAIIQQLQKEKYDQKQKEKAHLDIELAFLKNQISPHFFFNSLNNVYALIAIDGDKAQETVVKLSDLMRYLIYESNIKTVELKREFEFMQNYVDLMQQRLTSKVKLSVNIQHDAPSVEIPPLIFIPFVENAFKHGISYRNESFITIFLKTEGNKLLFKCENSVPKNTSKLDNKEGGVGIVNIKRRLNLLYGDKAQLIQSCKNDIYTIELHIPLNYKL